MALKGQNFLTIVFLCFIISAQSRSVSISQVGDIRIEITDTKWICDKIECPSDTDRCYVSKMNDPNDPSILVRKNICYSKDNQPLEQSVTTSQIDPNNKIKVEINANRNGNISSSNFSNGGEDFDEEKFNEELQAQLANLQQNIQAQIANINKDVEENLNKLSYDLAHMFD